MAALEVGVSAAIAAWAANWYLLRRVPPVDDDLPEEPARIADQVEFEDPEPVLATADMQPRLPDGVTPIGEKPDLPGAPRPRTDSEPGSVTPLRKRPPRDRP